jgi:hypothetical protein
MTSFLDVRIQAVGGGLAAEVGVCQATTIDNYQSLDPAQMLKDIRGCHVLIATHGFNNDRAAGIASLSNWATLLQLPPTAAFVGLLWPGDSIWAHGLDYPDEPKIADEAGALLGPWLDINFAGAASISFASHSLGARVVLATISNMNLPIRRVALMAGAIDDNCLNKEFQPVTENIGEISILASAKDTVLSEMFPLGNFFAGIIAEGHPWWRAAIGHKGPAKPLPANFQAPYEIPDDWSFNHGNYLQIDQPPPAALPLPVDVPPQGSSEPSDGGPGWQEAFTAAFVSTRFR